MSLSRLAVVVLLLSASLACTRSRTVDVRVLVWEEDVSIPTYALLPDDVNPHFRELGEHLIYPYTMQDALGTTRTARRYRALFLENEHLKVMVLPEIGGRIQSVYDKRREAEVFYRNHVVKPGLIALRGAWIPGGVEWNRGPQGHTVTSFSPVDVVPVAHPDGAASLVIGATEMHFRTGWEVRLTLHPGRAYLDERIRLFNPTDTSHPYYFWNNTAFPNRSGTRYVFPMSLGTDHEGTSFVRWPEHEGRDLTWLRNYSEPTSIFAVGSAYGFFGAYDVERDAGIVQVADHRLLPGKKAWTWGEAEAGRRSQEALTDGDGAYIEVQSGPLPTQSDYGLLAPGDEVAWQEWWLPVFDLGEGFEFATRDLVAQRREQGADAELRLLATGTWPGATVAVSVDGAPRVEARIDLDPRARVSVLVPQAADRAIDVRITSGSDHVLAAWRSPLPIPGVDPPAVESPERATTPQRAFLEGDRRDREMDRVGAREGYRRALHLDPGHIASLRALGELDAEAGRFTEAVAWFERAVALDPRNGLAWYGLGAALMALGRVDEALDAGYRAVRQREASLGYDLVGRALMRQGRPGEARAAFAAGVDAGGGNRTRLTEHTMIAAWADGRRDEALALARTEIQGGTIRLVPHAVAGLVQGETLGAFAADARRFVGEDEFAFLELATTFIDLGLEQEAARLLRAATLDGLSTEALRPLPLYYLAWLAARADDAATASTLSSRAATLAPDYVFPSRPESIPVLRDALARTPGDARARTYLGNLLAGLGRYDEAVSEWHAAFETDGTASVAARNLALVEWKLRGDPAAAEAWFRRAIGARPSDQTLYRDLATLLGEQGRAADALDVLAGVRDVEGRRADVTALLAKTLVAVGRSGDALDVLAGTAFSNWESNTKVWAIFADAHLRRGEERLRRAEHEAALADFEAAMTYPPNLGVGRPARPEHARAQYWRGRALAALGRDQEAAAAWSAGASSGPGESKDEIAFRARCAQELTRLGLR